MPGMDGIEAARQLNSLVEPPAVIFTTAYDEYAVNAFDAQAVGYLLKPIRKEKLAAALVAGGAAHAAAAAADRRHATAEAPPKRTHIAARHREGLRLIPIDDIQFFFAEQKYTTVRHLKGEDLIEDSLRALEEEFRQNVRAHPPECAGERAIPRGHRAEWRGAVLREAARLSDAVAGEPAHGERAAGSLQDLAGARVGRDPRQSDEVIERVEVQPLFAQAATPGRSHGSLRSTRAARPRRPRLQPSDGQSCSTASCTHPVRRCVDAHLG